MIDVRHLQIVDAIARAGTVTAAARQLHLTQPAVSHALADLEKRVGMPLFRRESRGMVLTPEGQRLVEAAAVVLREIRDAENDLRLRREGCQGVIRLATECYTCYHWLPAILAHFTSRFPDIDVKIATDATEDPSGALLADRLDLAIMHSEGAHPELVSEPLFMDELVAVVPLEHPLADRTELQPEDFADQVLFLHSDPESSPFVTEFLGPAGVYPARVLELRFTEAVLAAVRANLGLTVIAQWAIRPQLEAGAFRALRLGRDGLQRSWRLVTRRDRAGRATIQELARLLKEESVVVPRGRG